MALLELLGQNRYLFSDDSFHQYHLKSHWKIYSFALFVKIFYTRFQPKIREAKIRTRYLKRVYRKTKSLKALKEFEKVKYHNERVIQKTIGKKFGKPYEKIFEFIQTMLKSSKYTKNTSFKQFFFSE